MSWLDDFLLAIRRVRNSAGEVQPPRAALQFGSGFTITDDPATNALIIGGGGGGGATGPTGPTGPTGATGPAGSSGVASQLPSGWAELAGSVGFSPGPTLIQQVSATTETTCHVWAAVSISWQTTLASSGAAFFVTLSNGINTYTSDETWSDATAADDDVSASINFRTPVPVAAGTWTARVYGRRTKSTSSLVCTHCDLTVLGFQGAQGATGPTGPAPSGDGVVLVEDGVAYAGLIRDVDVSATAAIAGSKIQAASALNAGAMSAADHERIPEIGDVDVSGRIATVTGLRGHTVGATVPTSGQVLQYDGAQWLPQTVATGITSGDVTVSPGGAATVTGLQGQPITSGLPLAGSLLAWDDSASEWTPYRVFEGSDLTYVPGTSLAVTGLYGVPLEPGSGTPGAGVTLIHNAIAGEWQPRSIIVSGDAEIDVDGAATVTGIQGVTVDPDASTPGNGVTLVYSMAAGKWQPRTYVVSGDVDVDADGAATVTGLRNDPIGATPPTTGQVLTYSGTQWAPATPTGAITSGDVTVSSGVATVVALQSRAVSSTAPVTGQVLAWTGSAWAPTVNPPAVFSAQINLKVTGDTLLGTTLASYGRFVVTEAWVHLDNIASLGITPPTVSIGWASGSGYSEFVSLQSLPNSGIVNNNYSAITLRSGSGRLSAPASTGIYCRVTQASNATTYTATIVVKGFYLVD